MSEISEPARQARLQFIEQLRSAGWIVETWDELFDGDGDVEPEAHAERRMGDFDAALSFHARDQHLGLELVERNGPAVFVLRLYPRSQADVLQLVIDQQRALDLGMCADLVKNLIPLCDPLIVEADDGHGLKLS